MPRLFTGLEIPAALADELSLFRGGLSGGRWIDPENYHITLRFIGDTDRHMARDISLSLAQIKRAAFTVTLAGLDYFGGDRPHAIVAKAHAASPLLELQAEQERLLRRISHWRGCGTRRQLRWRIIWAIADFCRGASMRRALCCFRRVILLVAGLIRSRRPIH